MQPAEVVYLLNTTIFLCVLSHQSHCRLFSEYSTLTWTNGCCFEAILSGGYS